MAMEMGLASDQDSLTLTFKVDGEYSTKGPVRAIQTN